MVGCKERNFFRLQEPLGLEPENLSVRSAFLGVGPRVTLLSEVRGRG